MLSVAMIAVAPLRRAPRRPPRAPAARRRRPGAADGRPARCCRRWAASPRRLGLASALLLAGIGLGPGERRAADGGDRGGRPAPQRRRRRPLLDRPLRGQHRLGAAAGAPAGTRQRARRRVLCDHGGGGRRVRAARAATRRRRRPAGAEASISAAARFGGSRLSPTRAPARLRRQRARTGTRVPPGPRGPRDRGEPRSSPSRSRPRAPHRCNLRERRCSQPWPHDRHRRGEMTDEQQTFEEGDRVASCACLR